MLINAEIFKNNDLRVKNEKMDITSIIEKSKTIDAQKAAKEVLTWVANNVEEFIDNQRKMFKLDLIIDAEDGAEETLPVVRALQNLYRSIPDDPVQCEGKDGLSFQSILDSLSQEDKDLISEIQRCKDELDAISKEIYQSIKEEKDLLNSLFKRMSFYYEIQGVSNGRLLIEELEGSVDVIKFEYEDFPVSVKVTNSGGEDISKYVIQEGFTVWIEIAFQSKQKNMSSLF
jgi:hypothetical protein